MAVNAESFEPNWELTQLLDIFPLPIRQALIRLPNVDRVIEVVLDLGRRPEARFEDDFVFLTDNPVTHEDMAAVVSHLSPFGGDNRAGIEQTLHRISAIRNRSGKIVGLIGLSRDLRALREASQVPAGLLAALEYLDASFNESISTAQLAKRAALSKALRAQKFSPESAARRPPTLRPSPTWPRGCLGSPTTCATSSPNWI